jgi:nicotinate-nucleotide adenylyltransferase
VRIGLFGGSFDPPHLAHLALARIARDTLALDELRWVPTGDPWHKPGRVVTPAPQRLQMLRMALADEPRMTISTIELDRSGPSYTLDTVEAMQAALAQAQWFLVIGQDQLARFDTWHRWQELAARVTLAVAARDGGPVAEAPALAALPHRREVLAMPAMPLSSSDVRRRVASGEGIAGMVPAAVARYIEQAHLYQGIRS